MQITNASLILSILIFPLGHASAQCSNRGEACGLFEHCCGDNLNCDNKVLGGKCICQNPDEPCGGWEMPPCCVGSWCRKNDYGEGSVSGDF
ncbi:hypothetical protein M413DRAFT_446052 [Hebeloma cylindrosporum]|uniref:Granulins domain-containing protein n=1 Tax=Hebeloma cylindrosporum TaxID=76867 RepID=A0A0C2XSE9_HEBCY|nr:hypothetical protein M413DRAFT_446052 [Hebeloma cylindrosporum h7]